MDVPVVFYLSDVVFLKRKLSLYLFLEVSSSFHTSVLGLTSSPSSRLSHARLQSRGRHLEEDGGCSRIPGVGGHSCSPAER